MLMIPKCYERGCVHFLGVTLLGQEETTEVPYCAAFPTGIPSEISYGDDKHAEPRDDQPNKLVFEEK